MSVRPSQRPAASSASCGIAGHALVEARLTEIAALRDQAGPAGAPALPPRFLRHCDEHTVVGMHAVLRALAGSGTADDVGRHAVVAASCQLGRPTAARTLAGLATGGGVSVSPHVVPQCSLHSVAGAVSVGLGMHGPHLGVAGGPDALAEGLFATTTLLQAAASADDLPCVWLVATEWDAEPVLDGSGMPLGDPLCRGLAVAIRRDPPARAADGGRASAAVAGHVGAGSHRAAPSAATSLSLSLHVPDVPRPRAQAAVAGRLAAFARALDMCRAGTALVSWAVECPWGTEIRVSRRPSARAALRLQEAA